MSLPMSCPFAGNIALAVELMGMPMPTTDEYTWLLCRMQIHCICTCREQLTTDQNDSWKIVSRLYLFVIRCSLFSCLCWLF